VCLNFVCNLLREVDPTIIIPAYLDQASQFH